MIGPQLAAQHVNIDLDQAVATALDARPDYLSLQRAVEQARRQAEIQATTQLRVQTTQLEDLRQEIEAQVRDAVQGVELTWRQVEAARLARALAAETLALEREKLSAGRASNFEVLSFEANLRVADTQELSASIAYLNALTTFDQQLGTTLETWRISLND